MRDTDLRRLVKWYKEQAELLNKDVFFYKRTNRELKRRIRHEGGSPDGIHDVSKDTPLVPPSVLTLSLFIPRIWTLITLRYTTISATSVKFLKFSTAESRSDLQSHDHP